MVFMNGLDQAFTQWNEVQRQFLKTWTPSMGEMPNMNMPNARKSFDNALEFQEQVITGSLELQGLLTRLSLEAQQQFWQNYFKMLRG